jgi:hypothetical protein
VSEITEPQILTVVICKPSKEELQLRAAPILFRATRFSSARLLLFSILLFYAGPQFGSIDADRDGSPEVPIIVLSSSSSVIVTQALNVTKDHRPRIISHTRILLPVVMSNQLPLNEFPKVDKLPNSLLGHPRLPSLGLLRC